MSDIPVPRDPGRDEDPSGVPADLPGFAWSLGRVLLVEADEQVDQLAAHWLAPRNP